MSRHWINIKCLQQFLISDNMNMGQLNETWLWIIVRGFVKTPTLCFVVFCYI